MWIVLAIRKIVKITDLIINPNNARYITPLDEYDEKKAIEVLCNDRDNHIDRLLEDIAKNDLNPNELPIIMPSQVYNDKYEVMDGNRRLTSIKLLLQYRNDVDNFEIPKLIKNAVKNAKIINVTEDIECVFSDDEIYINDLLEKLHTHRTGISTVPWKPMAQERHSYKKGDVTKVNALIRFLETSKYSDEIIIRNLHADGWIHKFKRFINNNKTIRYYFGFEFSKGLDKINMLINEQEIVKGLGQLLQDSIDKLADGFAQKEEDRNKYLDKFEHLKIVDKSKINDPVLAYHIEDGHISATTIAPLPKPIDKQNIKENSIIDGKKLDNLEKSKVEYEQGKNENFGGKPLETSGITEEIFNVSNDKLKSNQENYEKDNNLSADGKENQVKKEILKNDTTDSRPCLIPRDIQYKVTDQRSIDLLEELQSTPIKGHRNLVSIGFRSFVEFTVTVFIEKKSTNYNNNRKDLLDKINHTVSKLESVYGQKELKNIIPKIYQLINTNKSNSEFGDIAMLNLFVHHHKYHPHEGDLKVIYNNYEPYLKILWDEINKK